MAALQFPCTIFKTQNRMDGYRAKDMRCGDLSEAQLKTHYHLADVSARANPYTLEKITATVNISWLPWRKGKDYPTAMRQNPV